MAELKMERRFSASPEKVFETISREENLMKWWGPEGMSLRDCALDFTKKGPWRSTMVNAEGGTFTVSGDVVTVDPPNALELTWAWHDESGERGHESKVRFEVMADGDGGSVFRLHQTGLADDESAVNHQTGWSSSFRKLEILVN